MAATANGSGSWSKVHSTVGLLQRLHAVRFAPKIARKPKDCSEYAPATFGFLLQSLRERLEYLGGSLRSR